MVFSVICIVIQRNVTYCIIFITDINSLGVCK